MEEEFVKYLICYLLEEQFHSKKEMAEQMGISYRELINASTGQCTQKTAVSVTGHILRYCIRQKVPLDTFSCPIIFS